MGFDWFGVEKRTLMCVLQRLGRSEWGQKWSGKDTWKSLKISVRLGWEDFKYKRRFRRHGNVLLTNKLS